MADVLTHNSNKKVIILIEDVDRLVLHALSYAKEVSNDIVAFSAITRQEKEEALRAEWNKSGIDIPYIIKFSPIKSAGELLSEFIDSSEKNKDVVILVPLVIMKSWWRKYLNRSYLKSIERYFTDKDNIILVKVPYYLEKAA